MTFRFESEPRYNAAPGQALLVITDADRDRVRRLEWSLVPKWADDTSEHHFCHVARGDWAVLGQNKRLIKNHSKY